MSSFEIDTSSFISNLVILIVAYFIIFVFWPEPKPYEPPISPPEKPPPIKPIEPPLKPPPIKPIEPPVKPPIDLQGKPGKPEDIKWEYDPLRF